jgi:hypothetical protein
MIERNDNLDTIKKYLQKGIKFTNAASLYFLLGLVYQLQHNFDSAYEAFFRAAKKDPWEIKYYREMVATKLILNTNGLDQELFFKNINQEEIKRLKKLSKNKKSKYFYPTLYAKFLNNPLSLGLDEYFMLYLGQSLQKNFSPQKRETDYLQVKEYLDNGDIYNTLEHGENCLINDVANIGMYYLLTLASLYNSDLDGFRKYYTPYLGFVMSMKATGKGDSRRSAMISASHIDELMVLNYLKYDQFIAQNLIKDKNHSYHVYQIARNGQKESYFFNIDLYSKFLH